MAAELSLEIVEGPEAGRVVPLSGPLEIGRDPDAGFRVEDVHVSGRHVRLTPEGDAALVEDLGDPGGTFVNDSEVAAPTRMRPGDELQIGVTVMQLRTGADLASQPSAVRPKPDALAAAEQESAAPAAGPAEHDPNVSEVEELLDVHTKTKARNAPLTLFVLVVWAVFLFLAIDRLY